MKIEEWIRQTSEMAVAPDTLVPNETRDANSPTISDSSLANSIKVSVASKLIMHYPGSLLLSTYDNNHNRSYCALCSTYLVPTLVPDVSIGDSNSTYM